MREPHTFIREPVDVRCAHLAAETTCIAIALVIGEDDDDVGLVGGQEHRAQDEKGKQEESAAHGGVDHFAIFSSSPWLSPSSPFAMLAVVRVAR